MEQHKWKQQYYILSLQRKTLYTTKALFSKGCANEDCDYGMLVPNRRTNGKSSRLALHGRRRGEKSVGLYEKGSM
eukprot:4716730-Ditylum_brightwellii.AAC.1